MALAPLFGAPTPRREGKCRHDLNPMSTARLDAPMPTSGARPMPDKPTTARKAFGDIAPALAAYTDEVLFGDVWERPGLSKRDRSLITVATLVALYRTNEMPGHMKRAVDNGLTVDELVEAITHIAFYAGWPTAMTAINIAKELFGQSGSLEPGER